MESRSFLGPSASWEDEYDSVFRHVCQHAAEVLTRRLMARIATLEGADVEALMLEIRCQMAEGAVTGHLSIPADLHDLAMELLMAREHADRL